MDSHLNLTCDSDTVIVILKVMIIKSNVGTVCNDSSKCKHTNMKIIRRCHKNHTCSIPDIQDLVSNEIDKCDLKYGNVFVKYSCIQGLIMFLLIF